MAEKKQPTDAQIIARLRRRREPATAAELGTSAARLSKMQEVTRVGVRHQTVRGKRVAGRPSVLWALNDSDEAHSAEDATTDPAARGRQGGLS